MLPLRVGCRTHADHCERYLPDSARGAARQGSGMRRDRRQITGLGTSAARTVITVNRGRRRCGIVRHRHPDKTNLRVGEHFGWRQSNDRVFRFESERRSNRWLTTEGGEDRFHRLPASRPDRFSSFGRQAPLRPGRALRAANPRGRLRSIPASPVRGTGDLGDCLASLDVNRPDQTCMCNRSIFPGQASSSSGTASGRVRERLTE